MSAENQPAEEQPEVVDISAIEDPGKLAEILRNPGNFVEGKPEPKEEDTVEEESEPETEEEVEQPAEEQTEEEKPEEAKPEEQPETGRRRLKVKMDHLSAEQQDVLALISKGKSVPDAQAEVVTRLIREGKSLKEAEAAVYGEAGRRRADAPEKPEAKKDETPEEDPVALKQAEIADLKKQRLQALEKDYDFKKAAEIEEKLDAAKDDLRELKEAAKAKTTSKAAEADTSLARAIEDSSSRAIALFPDAHKEGTELFEAVQDEVEYLQESNPDFFKNPNWPEQLVAVEAAKLGIPSSKHGGVTPQPGEQKKPVAPKKPARPVPASGTSGGSANQPTEPATPEEALAAAGDDPEKILAFLRKHGTRDENGSLADIAAG